MSAQRPCGALYSRLLMANTCHLCPRVYLFAVGVLSGACLPGASPMLLSQPLSSAAELPLCRAFGVWVWHSPHRAVRSRRPSRITCHHTVTPFMSWYISPGETPHNALGCPRSMYHVRLIDGGRSSSRTSRHFHVRYAMQHSHGIITSASPISHPLIRIVR